MLTVNITYHAETRLMEITSVSTGNVKEAVATTGDDMATRLQFTFDDPNHTLDEYGARVEFGVNLTNTEDSHAYHPFIELDEENGATIPNSILSNVKCSVLPIQLAFGNKNGRTDESEDFYSLNILNLAINKSLDATAESPVERYPQVNDAVYDVEYDADTSTFTFVQIDGSHITVHLTDLAEDHFEVATYDDLVTLSHAERGDTAKTNDTGYWYKLYGSYDNLDNWYLMAGAVTINGRDVGTPVFYAPHVSGTRYQMLVSDGESDTVTERPPVWTTISKKYILNFTSSVHDIDVPNEMETDDLFCKFTDSNGNDIMLEYFTQTKNNIDYITISTNLSETINMQVFAIPYVRAVNE